jgi:hypothetical protein
MDFLLILANKVFIFGTYSCRPYGNFLIYFYLCLLSLDVSVPESAPMEEGWDGAEKSVHPDDDQGDEGGGGGRQRELTVLR